MRNITLIVLLIISCAPRTKKPDSSAPTLELAMHTVAKTTQNPLMDLVGQTRVQLQALQTSLANNSDANSQKLVSLVKAALKGTDQDLYKFFRSSQYTQLCAQMKTRVTSSSAGLSLANDDDSDANNKGANLLLIVGSFGLGMNVAEGSTSGILMNAAMLTTGALLKANPTSEKAIVAGKTVAMLDGAFSVTGGAYYGVNALLEMKSTEHFEAGMKVTFGLGIMALGITQMILASKMGLTDQSPLMELGLLFDKINAQLAGSKT